MYSLIVNEENAWQLSRLAGNLVQVGWFLADHHPCGKHKSPDSLPAGPDPYLAPG